MLKIRLQRVGRKHETSFRLVLTDSENSTKSGRLKEVLGSYDPRKTTDLFKTDRIKHWLGVGAKATGTVHNLLIDHKIIEGKKINVLPRKTPIKKEEAPAGAAPVAEVAAATQTETPSEPVVESTEAPAEATPVAEEPAA